MQCNSKYSPLHCLLDDLGAFLWGPQWATISQCCKTLLVTHTGQRLFPFQYNESSITAHIKQNMFYRNCDNVPHFAAESVISITLLIWSMHPFCKTPFYGFEFQRSYLMMQSRLIKLWAFRPWAVKWTFISNNSNNLREIDKKAEFLNYLNGMQIIIHWFTWNNLFWRIFKQVDFVKW